MRKASKKLLYLQTEQINDCKQKLLNQLPTQCVGGETGDKQII
ncbi:hypothetical protein HMPREF1870_02904 [Bacteroidales bacterium KA00344]|nr:hypothetical protein HMPREF1870_02904 [Bacteroidales bacterium KA00344]